MPSSGETGAQRTIAYVSSAGTKEIIALGIDVRAGRFEPLAAAAVPGPEGPSPTSMPLALSPDRRLLYVAVRSAPYPLSTFRIDPDNGELSLLSTVSLPEAMAYVATDRTGGFLFGASYLGAKLSVNAIGRDGEVEAPAREEIQTMETLPSHATLAAAADMHITPDGRFLYSSERTTSSLAAFAVDRESGTLELTGTYATEPSPRGFNISPCGRWLLAAGQTSNRTSMYAIDGGDGSLTKTFDGPTGANPNWIEFSNLG